MALSVKNPEKRERFTEIYHEYYPVVFNTVFSKIENETDASDICQEIFLIFFNKFDEVENPRAWLFGVMKNVVLRFYRDQKNSGLDIDAVFDDSAMIYVNGFRDTRLMITEAMESVNLDEKERQVLDYVALSNYSYSNVGKIIGMTKRQVGYAYQNAVRKITDYLKTKGIQDLGDLL
jgi:RNA polymerase sigma factor (sigma-70 family)